MSKPNHKQNKNAQPEAKVTEGASVANVLPSDIGGASVSVQDAGEGQTNIVAPPPAANAEVSEQKKEKSKPADQILRKFHKFKN